MKTEEIKEKLKLCVEERYPNQPLTDKEFDMGWNYHENKRNKIIELASHPNGMRGTGNYDVIDDRYDYIIAALYHPYIDSLIDKGVIFRFSNNHRASLFITSEKNIKLKKTYDQIVEICSSLEGKELLSMWKIL